MFRRFKKAFKRAVIFIISLVLVAVVVMTIINLRNFFKARDVMQVVIDAGSLSNTDTWFALTRALTAAEIHVIAIISPPEFTSGNIKNVNTDKYETLLQQLHKTDIPVIKGAAGELNPPSETHHQTSSVLSPASSYIIRESKKMTREDKLNLITLGAFTNPAASVSADPSIIPKLRIYSLGSVYDHKKRVWNKNEPNIRRDLSAFDLLLDTPGLEMNIMPVSTSGRLIFSKTKIFRLMKEKGGIWQFIASKWQYESTDNDEYIMHKTALVESIINPQFAKSGKVLTPPENYRRYVNIYSYINREQMILSFENAVKKAK